MNPLQLRGCSSLNPVLGRTQENRKVVCQAQGCTRRPGPQPLKGRLQDWQILWLDINRHQILDGSVELAAFQFNKPGVPIGKHLSKCSKEGLPELLPFEPGGRFGGWLTCLILWDGP